MNGGQEIDIAAIFGDGCDGSLGSNDIFGVDLSIICFTHHLVEGGNVISCGSVRFFFAQAVVKIIVGELVDGSRGVIHLE